MEQIQKEKDIQQVILKEQLKRASLRVDPSEVDKMQLELNTVL